ncbi:hypothetical protein BDN70DRAFT_924223 [Pholiota conissans]|uniref:Heterokaryon incompatibility domain-containing protein n=1 Tax=Pholiota conissans TaxID=109636 RepID=A0A9P5YSJ9_9AGAR|nr:hypothetical protein BDN70DRAFT_924223 [Pholiota conissans]
MQTDPWFTRGWTLRELLAPHYTKFYNKHWQELIEVDIVDAKRKERIMKQINIATAISRDEMSNIHEVPISRRIQLEATRQITRDEDTMRIFNVSIATAYGEGAKRAFYRLLQEIVATSIRALDIFNGAKVNVEGFDEWDCLSHILASSPQYYLKGSSHPELSLERHMQPLALTHLGVRVLTFRWQSSNSQRVGSPVPSPSRKYASLYL